MDYLYLILVNAVAGIIRVFPIGFGLWLGRRIGDLAYLTQIKRRLIARRNIKMAGVGKLNPALVARRSFQNIGMSFMELLYFPKIDSSYADKYLTIEGREHIEEALKKGKGIIFLSGHVGNWELMAFYGALIGYPSYIIARKQKFNQLDRMLNRYRELNGSRMVPKGMAVRELLKVLPQNKITAILTDQDAGKKGIMVNFFGRMSSTAPGAIELALRTGATVLPVFIYRTRGAHHRVSVNPPIEIKSVEYALTKFNLLLEKVIRQHPEQWLWQHKRWKTKYRREILILNDGKIGHLNQSQAIANMHFSDDICRMVDVKFRSPLYKLILSFCAIFARPGCQECLRCVKFCLKKESFGEVASALGDIIISCGSSSAPVSAFLKSINSARSIAIMRPPGFLFTKFDLIIAPGHDRLKESSRVLVTQGVPNREALYPEPDSPVPDSPEPEKRSTRTIGLLFGGENRYYTIDQDLCRVVIDGVLKFAEKIDGKILLTTSRRTSQEAEEYIRKRLKGHPRTDLMVIASEENPPGTIHRILSSSTIVIVSGESLSMVSEAASSGATTVGFLPRRRKQIFFRPKHEKALDNLARRGYLTLVKPEELGEKLHDIWQNKKTTKKLDDMARIKERLMRLK